MAGPRELTAEEKGRPYSKYSYRGHAGPTPESAPLLARHSPMDPAEAAEALPVERRDDSPPPGYPAGETGYCALPSGGAYVAVRRLPLAMRHFERR